jgi:hypothetical protein
VRSRTQAALLAQQEGLPSPKDKIHHRRDSPEEKVRIA